MSDHAARRSIYNWIEFPIASAYGDTHGCGGEGEFTRAGVPAPTLPRVGVETLTPPVLGKETAAGLIPVFSSSFRKHSAISTRQSAHSAFASMFLV